MGWDGSWAEALRSCLGNKEGLQPGRVVREHRGAWAVITDRGELTLRIPGSMRHRRDPVDLPVVGDWVVCKSGKGRRGTIVDVLPRRSLFVRKAAGPKARPQAVAANVDLVLVMIGLDGDYNLRRLERYLAATCDSGAESLVVLNKRDLNPEWPERLAEVRDRTGVQVVATDAVHGALDTLPQLLKPRRTICLLGSSGVGKSTLLNALMGRDVQKTQTVRERDQRGKHTTSHRELFELPGGALMIDTPGMRELHLWEADEGLSSAFEDSEHLTEPGCAIKAAVEAGEIEIERVESWRKLRGELDQLARHKELERRRRSR